MVASTCPTCAERLPAVIGHVALQASCRLFFTLLGIDMFLADNKAISKHCIRVFRAGHDSKNVPTCLFSSPVVWRFDPPGSQEGIWGELVELF